MMKIKIFRWLAIVLIMEIGLLHFFTAQSEYEEAAYMGYLFMLNFLGAIISAYGIFYKQGWGWMLGFFVAAGSIAGYAWSRTLGMPGMNVEEWFTPYGVMALTLESFFILLLLLRPWRITSTDEIIASEPKKFFRYLPQMTGLISIILLSVFTFQWDVSVKQIYGHHVGSLAQVCKTPLTSKAELEERYGVQVSLVAASMMNSIVDVRLKIIDPEKAHAFLQNQAALLVNQEALILAPHMHSHTGSRLKAGKMFILFFPTQQLIHIGSEVSLVLGGVRMEPVIVR